MELYFVSALIFVLVIFILVGINYKKIGTKFNRSYTSEININETKNFYFKKHYCKNCNQKLVRNHEREFIENSWDTKNDSFFYGKKYRVKTSLKCPSCQKKYQLEDL